MKCDVERHVGDWKFACKRLTLSSRPKSSRRRRDCRANGVSCRKLRASTNARNAERSNKYLLPKDMRPTKIAVCIDLLFCLVILPFIIMMMPVDKWYVHNTWFLITFVSYLYLLYFIYRKSNIPSLVMRRRYGTVVMIVAAMLLLTVLVGDFPQSENTNRTSFLDLAVRQRIRRQTVWFFFLIITGFSLSIELTIELFRQIISKQEIEAEKNKAELALYKAQINPHFLFNTLNAIYGLVITKSEKTESALMKFSNILRYMYAHTNSLTIPVSSEIDYIRQYVDLQSMRLNHHTRVEFEVHAEERDVQIPPMILITFVENAFKYGSSSDEDCLIVIRIDVKDGVLCFETENDVMKTPPPNEPAIGIENCRKRLEMLYPGRFTLEITERNRKFRTRLTIRLR